VQGVITRPYRPCNAIRGSEDPKRDAFDIFNAYITVAAVLYFLRDTAQIIRKATKNLADDRVTVLTCVCYSGKMLRLRYWYRARVICINCIL